MSIVCLNGTLMDAGAARIDPSDRGFTLGDGLFETIAVTAGTPRRLPAHLARLRDGASVLDLPLPWSDAQLAQWIEAAVSANSLADAAVRLTVSRGPGPRGVLPPAAPAPTLVIAAAPRPDMDGPVTLSTCGRTRRNQHSPLARIKSLNYLDNVLAR
ncbi:MAG: aminotransferase class IV, partial [Rhodospirillaceae bacterium]|nr:aminotransferase class IV [Rhodospirillaceae bacterium]